MGITISNILLTELDFTRAQKLPEQFNYSFHLEVGVNYKKDQDTAQVALKVTIDEEKKSIQLKCCMLGIFKIQDETNLPLPIDDFLNVNAPALIFPYVRELVTNTTQRAGMKPVYIPIFNFKDLYDKQKVENLNKESATD